MSTKILLFSRPLIAHTAHDVERIFSLNVTVPTGGFVSGNRYTMNVAIGGTTTQTGEIKISKGWVTGDAEGTTGNMETN